MYYLLLRYSSYYARDSVNARAESRTIYYLIGNRDNIKRCFRYRTELSVGTGNVPFPFMKPRRTLSIDRNQFSVIHNVIIMEVSGNRRYHIIRLLHYIPKPFAVYHIFVHFKTIGIVTPDIYRCV